MDNDFSIFYDHVVSKLDCNDNWYNRITTLVLDNPCLRGSEEGKELEGGFILRNCSPEYYKSNKDMLPISSTIPSPIDADKQLTFELKKYHLSDGYHLDLFANIRDPKGRLTANCPLIVDFNHENLEIDNKKRVIYKNR